MDAEKPLRIALFTETFLPKVDGVVTILCLMLRRMHELGHKVLVFGPKGSPAEFEGAQVVGVHGPPLPFYPELRLNLPRRGIGGRLRKFQPDVVHVVHPMMLGTFGMGYARWLGAPTVASFHTHLPRYAQHYGVGFLAPFLWWYSRTQHNRAHVNLCTSRAMRDELREQGFQRVRWWRRGIDTVRFCPGTPATQARDAAMRQRLTGGNPDTFLVVNVGRQAPEKGLMRLRDNIFPQEGVSLALVGDGPSHEQLQSHYAHTATVFPGYLQGDDLIAAYRAADAFVFPSTTETFGLVALEAMACGAPVIAARTGGVLDTIEDGKTGLFFEPEQPAQIGELICKLRTQPELRAKLAANGLAHAQSRSWRSTMDQLVDYYRVAMRMHRMENLA